MRSGALYQRAPWVPHTDDAGCTYWPTPRAMLGRAKAHIIPGRVRSEGWNLEEAVAHRGDSGGYVNPLWAAWLMGFPEGWLSPLYEP